MKIERVPFSDVPQFSKRDVAYTTGKKELQAFAKYPVEIEAFERAMADKAGDDTDRDLLADTLERQYTRFDGTEAIKGQIAHLRSRKTFTVITAHQPALFTGPLYYVLKICSTINLARQLEKHYPDNRFIPIFISGAEDHDFEEINHTYVYGNRIDWEAAKGVGGPVGKLSTQSLERPLQQLQEILGDRETAKAMCARIEKSYTGHALYGDAAVALAHELFGKYGLVVVDMSQPAFKEAFRPIMERELFESVSQPLIEKTQSQLEDLGYSGQAHAREINLFYLGKEGDRRDRIERRGDRFHIVDRDASFSTEEMREELKEYPQRFSPNVVMRPLYQESIFPNLAYIGGGGELAYWLERKAQFETFGLNFPMLVRRNSVLWIDKGNQKKLAKLELDYRQLFRDADLIIRDYVAERSDNELSLADEKKALADLFDRIAEKAAGIDPTLEKAVRGEHSRQAKAVENLEGRLRRTEKQRFDVAMNQIRGLRDKLFPQGGMQERYDSFLNIYLQEGERLFEVLIERLDPLTEGLVVVQP